MKPRVFVSSTFYDLKYIREDLSNFIKEHDFEPIMFENGDIGYTPGQPLDEACYKTMQTTDMVLLIIGGQYGSPATGEIKDGFKEYMSVTRNEFKEAAKRGIPLYVFVDGKVYAEYDVYEANYNEIENEKLKINFANTKDINVFRFIHEIKNIGKIHVMDFTKSAEIKDFLRKQWSHMFKLYLDILKEREVNSKFESTVEDMNLLINRMDIMLDTVGKKLLSGESDEEYIEVKNKQKMAELADIMADGIGFNPDMSISKKENVSKCLEVLREALEQGMIEEDMIYGPVTEMIESETTINFFEEKGVDVFFISFTEEELYEIERCLADSEKREEIITLLSKERYYRRMVL